MIVSLNVDGPALREAKKRMALLEAMAHGVIVVLTAEQALKAQKVVRESGRKKRER